LCSFGEDRGVGPAKSGIGRSRRAPRFWPVRIFGLEGIVGRCNMPRERSANAPAVVLQGCRGGASCAPGGSQLPYFECSITASGSLDGAEGGGALESVVARKRSWRPPADWRSNGTQRYQRQVVEAFAASIRRSTATRVITVAESSRAGASFWQRAKPASRGLPVCRRR